MKYTLEDIRTALKNSGIDIVGCVPMEHIIKLVEDALNKQFAERQATYEEFIEKHCKECRSQRCEGIDTAWFDGCPFRSELTSVREF